jgi:hypothetical protein
MGAIERKSFTAKDSKGAKEKVQLHREGRESAKEQKSFNAKESIIKSETNPKAAKELRQGWNLDTQSVLRIPNKKTSDFGGNMTRSVSCMPLLARFLCDLQVLQLTLLLFPSR